MAQSDLGGGRRGAVQTCVPGAGQAVRLVRFAARLQPADRPKWLCNKLYSGLFTADFAAETHDFYRRFYHIDLSAAQLKALLEPAA